MQYSSYITSTEHKISYTINVLYMFALHIPARLLQWYVIMITNGWYM